MPRLPKPGEGLSDRQRHLAEFIAQGHSLKESYKMAGYEGSTGVYADNSITKSADFKYYLFWLREQTMERTFQSMDLLLKQLDDVRLLAMMEREPMAAVNAIMGKAKILGMLVERSEIEHSFINKPSREPTDVLDLTVDEWKEKFAPKQLQ